MGKKGIKRVAAAFVCIFTVLMMTTMAMAKEPVDILKNVTLTINYTHEKQPIPNGEFKLYKVADTDAKASLIVAADFAKYPVKIVGSSDEEWQSLALTLYGYAQRDQINPVCSGKTDSAGQLKFPNTSAALKPGLYLVTGKGVEMGGYIYKAKPALIFLPALNNDNNTWNYEVTMEPKYERSEKGRLISCKVLKIWEDNGYKQKRPQEVTVDLLRDGKVFSTIRLNSSNNWRYTWNDLPDKYDWIIVEKEVKGYTVRVAKEGVTYTVTNTYVPDTPPSDPPDNPPKVPQTGLLWWPVPILVVGGLLFISIGVIRKKKSER